MCVGHWDYILIWGCGKYDGIHNVGVESLGSVLICGVLAMWCHDGWCCARSVVPGFLRCVRGFVFIVAGAVGLVVVVIGGSHWLTL